MPLILFEERRSFGENKNWNRNNADKLNATHFRQAFLIPASAASW